MEVIGRVEEREILQKLLKNDKSDLVAVYGRRRVGKTYLIRNFFANQMKFYCSGQWNATLNEQLNNFRAQLQNYFPKLDIVQTPENWQHAFSTLRQCIDKDRSKSKKVLFFDELPWLDTHKSGFLSSFEYFWNVFASQRNDLLVVVCGSAASWMIKKIVSNKGGLHNRITQRIRLLPFTLQETSLYMKYRKVTLSHDQLLQLYMSLGGIPHYLNAVERGRSVPQLIDQLCFSKDGALSNEFENLYRALFHGPEKHIEIIHVLASKNKGMTRGELLENSKLSTGGGMTTVLEELEESGFISRIHPFEKKKKDALYRLTDEFSLFYLRFMSGRRAKEVGQWIAQSTTPRYRSWCGYAFENLCLKHVHAIKHSLGIAGVYTEQSSWLHVADESADGVQIDLLIDRQDQCINLCEMKFSEHPFVIDKKYAASLQRKLMTFKRLTKSRKAVFLTMVTTYGVQENAYKQQLVDIEIGMEKLFRG